MGDQAQQLQRLMTFFTSDDQIQPENRAPRRPRSAPGRGVRSASAKPIAAKTHVITAKPASVGKKAETAEDWNEF
jgi:hypothetical protein